MNTRSFKLTICISAQMKLLVAWKLAHVTGGPQQISIPNPTPSNSLKSFSFANQADSPTKS